MSKINEYIKLLKKMRAAKRDLSAAQQRITVYSTDYNLDKSEDAEIAACINKCEKVISKKLNLSDDTGFVKYCDLFAELPCEDRKCPLFAKNFDYAVAKDRYDVAVDAYREFIKNLRKGRTK